MKPDYRDYLAIPSRRRSRWPLFFGLVRCFIALFWTAVFLIAANPENAAGWFVKFQTAVFEKQMEAME